MDIDDDYVVPVQRRRGQPNRGGGRANRRGGRQGRGRGSSGRGQSSGGRGQSSGYRGQSSGGSGQRGRGRGRGGRGRDRGGYSRSTDYDDSGSSARGRSQGRGKPIQLSRRADGRGSGRGDVRVQMQKLHMSTENQAMVRDMLRELHTDGADGTGSNHSSDEDYRSDTDQYEQYSDEDNEEYWPEDDNPIVEGAVAYGWEAGPGGGAYGVHQERGGAYCIGEEDNPYSHLNPYAVNKLTRYGFEKRRCEKALFEMDGDIGLALEHLLSQCFDLSRNVVSDDQVNGDENWSDIQQQREDEKTALESIYEKSFTERIPNHVWIVGFESQTFDRVFPVQGIRGAQRTGKGVHQKSKEMCVFYKKGNCRKGTQCKFSHSRPETDLSDFKHLNIDPGETLYELEIRFPPGNKYPYSPPYLAFSSTNHSLPITMCLTITNHLMQEATSLAESGLPAIFSLISCLEDEALMNQLTNCPPMKFSLPEPVLTRYPQKPVVLNVPEPVKSKHRLSPSSRNSSLENVVDSAKNNEAEELVDDDKSAVTEDIPELETEVTEPVRPQKATRKDILPRKRHPKEIMREDRLLKERFKKRKSANSYKAMMTERQKLPAWSMSEDILTLVEGSQVAVVSGMTGCGKTTQVPQFILDRYLTGKQTRLCSIVCTQPRRISAVAVAGRVAEERTEKLGGIVGYQIRLESVQSSQTRLLFCTTGIILRRLEGDPTLEGVTHVIIDEVHERSEDSDFLMMVLRDLLPSRPDLKVILMSATVNAELFSNYFDECPVIEIPGKVFPVEQFFIEDAFEFTGVVVEDKSPYARPLNKMNAVRDSGVKAHGACVEDQIDMDLQSNVNATEPASDKIRDENLSVKQLKWRYQGYSNRTIKSLAMMDYDQINYELIEAIMEWFLQADHEYPRDGAILVFLPGFAEIQTLYDQLESSPVFGGRNKQQYKIIPLHSSLSSEDQHAVFSRPKEGVTKIVIATNIAETSITIDDVICVIDGGRMKEKKYDASKGMESLDMVWVSRANALQRKGRAGRVASGICFHLFTSHRFDFSLREQPIPEIQRAPLEQIVLQIRMLDLFKHESPATVLNKLLEPPAMDSITSAIKRLQDLGALDMEGELTPLGYHLGSLPVDVRIGKLMLFGAIFRCLDPALTIAATLSFKSPFVSPFGKKEEADEQKQHFAVGNSDHLTMLNGYNEWLSVKKKHGGHKAYEFCRENFLSVKTLQMLSSMKQQFVELLSDIGFVREGLNVRDVERASRGNRGDGVKEVTGPEANSNSSNRKLVAAILVGALYPNVVKVMTPEAKFSLGSAGAVPRLPKPEEIKFKTKMDGYVFLHPSSVNFQVRYYDSPYLVYHEKVKTSKVFIRDSTMVSVYPLLLFGGGNFSVDLNKGNFVLSVDDGWIRFLASSHQVAELVKELRLELDQLLENKIENPNIDLSTCPRGSKIISTIVKLISTQ